jgi:hypothetical protein
MEQKKKVQIRFQTCSNPIRNANHDFRISKPNYLRTEMYHNKFENIYCNFQVEQVKEQMKKSYDDYNEKYKKRVGRNLQKGRQSDLLTGVITLSPIVNEWLADEKISKEDLDKCFIESMPKVENKIEEILGNKVQTFSYVIHYDEKTPHLHFSFSNHTNNGESIFHKIKLSGRLNEFQDVVAEVFKDINLERGDRKSKVKHLSVRRMHEEEIKALKLDIKDIQNQKREIKSNLEKSKEQKKKELDKLDSEIKSNRNEIDNLTRNINIKKEIKIENSQFLRSKIKTNTQEIIDNSSTKEELQEQIENILEAYSNTNYISNKEYILESEQEESKNTINDLETEKSTLANKVSYLEEKIDSRTVISDADVEIFENEATILINEINQAHEETLETIRKESIVYKKTILGKKEEFDINTFMKRAKKREEFLLYKIKIQSSLINRLIKVLKHIASFYKKAFSPMLKDITASKNILQDTKSEISKFLNTPIFSNDRLILFQLNISKDSLIKKHDSKYFNMHQLNLKVEFTDTTNKDEIIKNIRSNLSQFDKVLNVSFSQDKENENLYYVNIIGEYKTDLNDVISDLKYIDIGSISSVDDSNCCSNNKSDEKSRDSLNRQG